MSLEGIELVEFQYSGPGTLTLKQLAARELSIRPKQEESKLASMGSVRLQDARIEHPSAFNTAARIQQLLISDLVLQDPVGVTVPIAEKKLDLDLNHLIFKQSGSATAQDLTSQRIMGLSDPSLEKVASLVKTRIGS